MERRTLGNLLIRCGAGENPRVYQGDNLPDKREDIPIAIDLYMAGHKNAKAQEISTRLETEKGIKIHPRTIYRYLEKKT